MAGTVAALPLRIVTGRTLPSSSTSSAGVSAAIAMFGSAMRASTCAVTSGGPAARACGPSSASRMRRSDSVLTRCGRPMASIQSTAMPASRARARIASSFIRAVQEGDRGQPFESPVQSLLARAGARCEEQTAVRPFDRAGFAREIAGDGEDRAVAQPPARDRTGRPTAWAAIDVAPSRCGIRTAARNASSSRYSACLAVPCPLPAAGRLQSKVCAAFGSGIASVVSPAWKPAKPANSRRRPSRTALASSP